MWSHAVFTVCLSLGGEDGTAQAAGKSANPDQGRNRGAQCQGMGNLESDRSCLRPRNQT